MKNFLSFSSFQSKLLDTLIWMLQRDVSYFSVSCTFTVFGYWRFSTTLVILPYNWTSGNSTPGTTWEPLKTYFTVCATNLWEVCPQQPAHQGLSHPALSTLQTSMPTHPAHLGNFVKASKGGGSPQNAATARPSSTTMVTPPKTEVKKRKKKKWTTPKCTVTSETVPAPEKKRKVISESPDSEAEGPFRDSDHTESASENSPNTNQ